MPAGHQHIRSPSSGNACLTRYLQVSCLAVSLPGLVASGKAAVYITCYLWPDLRSLVVIPVAVEANFYRVLRLEGLTSRQASM
jgi:hypothetical protein